jgi:flagellar M-ring protein FliF
LDSLLSVWLKLDTRRRVTAILASLAVFAAVLALSRGVGASDLALLYAGLEPEAAGEVITALEQRGVAYEVRGDAIYVTSSARDVLRMSLASEGLPASNAQGYELLDGLSGFGTTAQMFDAAYWRAKEGELARTILSSPYIRTARVHISSPANRPFQREQHATAAVTVTTAEGTLSANHAKALRYLVASAVSGLSPDDVAVIDGEGGLIANGDDPATMANGADRGAELRARAERLLEARVGFGNVVVELSLDTVNETEQITERSFDPDSRVAVSTDVQESSDSSTNSASGDVTVASNLPDGNASGGAGNSNAENTQTRSLTNFEVSETQREVLRAAGAIKRITVAVLVNDVTAVDAAGATTTTPRSDEELAAMRDLVASAVGFDEARGDVITIKSMAFEPIAIVGTEGLAAPALPINIMAALQIGATALVALVLGLFVIRPILTSNRTGAVAALPSPASFPGGFSGVQGAGTGGAAIDQGRFAVLDPPAARIAEGAGATDDPVARLRKMIDERQEETFQILQSWIEDPEDVERA